MALPRKEHLIGSGGGRVLKIVCVVGVIGLLPVGLVAAAWASFEYREAVERQRMSDFTIRWIAARSEIYIRGSIGPGFAHKLLHLLAQEPTARRIVITSPGGWVKEAVMTASLVEKSGTDVVARETCNSACILVLLAAHKRYADWDMVFGFHIPVDLLPNRDGTFARASSAGVKFVEGFMTDHHVPGWIIADMERAGPNDVAAISAIQLAEENLLTGLLDGDAPVTLNQAKWLWVERMVDAARLGFRINSDSLSRHRFAGCVRRGPLREHPLRNRPAQEPRPLRL